MLDGEDSVRVEVLAVGIEDVCRQTLVTGSGRNHVQVRRSPGVPARGFQHLADRAVTRDGVRRWANTYERVAAIGLRPEPPSQMALRSGGVLDCVELVTTVLPHIQLGLCDRRAIT